MRRTVLDVETKVTHRSYVNRKGETSKWIDNSPYEPQNYLVSIGVVIDPADKPNETEYFLFKHNDHPGADTYEAHHYIQKILDATDILICHNAKFDLGWLLECGFKYDKAVYCTQIAEYVMMKGQKKPFKLGMLAEEHNLPRKKSELVDDLWDQGVGFEAMPWHVVEEYGRADCVTTAHLYQHQMRRLVQSSYKGLIPTIKMMCEFLKNVLDMERHGIKIDMEALAELKMEYLQELHDLDTYIEDAVRDAMGDTLINMDSPDFCSALLYSLEVKDKKIWKQTFNLGKDEIGRDKYKPHMSKKRFFKTISNLTRVAQKTEALHCDECDGRGIIYTLTKAGVPYKNMPKCKVCKSVGIVYKRTGVTAGFGIVPRGVKDVKAAGFTTNKDDLSYLLDTSMSEEARIFLQKFNRRNQVTTYISTYIEGIEKHVYENAILHTSLNQTVAATARLSSTGPNLHNQPRGGTFPVRKVFVSRFADGSVCDGDYGQLEFRAAGFLSGCPKVLSDINEGVDVHAFTRDTINNFDPALEQINRQNAKGHTFKPLYGGQSGTPRERKYYEAFIEKYQGIKSWHEVLKAGAIRDGVVVIPTGREYSFPNARRLSSGYVLGTTQIVNYPVQGFATADLVPLGIISLGRVFRCEDLQSIIVLTVHDSILVDVYPGEEEQVATAIRKGLLNLKAMCQEFYGFEFDYPLEVDVKVGPNWLETV